jgi:hypothetical protein
VLKDKDQLFLIMKLNVLTNFPDYQGSLETLNDVKNLLPFMRVIRIADQWNLIDEDDEQSTKAKDNLSDYLGSSTCIKVLGMSMNSSVWRKTSYKQVISISFIMADLVKKNLTFGCIVKITLYLMRMKKS